jgi:parallel beta-helix repeat protein
MVSLIKPTTVNVVRAATTAAPMATLALLAAFGATRAVASIVVDPNPTPCVSATTHYTTIQAAVSAATSGATIQVCPANYAEQVTIATPLTLKGVTNTTGNTGAAVVTIPNNTFSGVYTQIVINATGVTLTDIGVDGTNSLSGCSSATLTGIMFDSGSSGSLKDVVARNHNISNGSGGYCGTGTPIYANGATSVTITDSSIRNFDATGIYLTATSAATVKTTTVSPIGPGSNCIYANAETVVVSNNSVAGCSYGLYVTSTTQGTVSGNTVHGGVNGVTGIFCFPVCTGLTVSGNLVFDTFTGLSMKTSGEVGGVTFEKNDINGTTNAVYLFLQPGNTVSNNTITDAQTGVNGASGNTISGNTYRTVTTLTQ